MIAVDHEVNVSIIALTQLLVIMHLQYFRALSPFDRHQSSFDGKAGKLNAIAASRLAQDVATMGTHGRPGLSKGFSDLFVAQASGDETEYLQFRWGQCAVFTMS